MLIGMHISIVFQAFMAKMVPTILIRIKIYLFRNLKVWGVPKKKEEVILFIFLDL